VTHVNQTGEYSMLSSSRFLRCSRCSCSTRCFSASASSSLPCSSNLAQQQHCPSHANPLLQTPLELLIFYNVSKNVPSLTGYSFNIHTLIFKIIFGTCHQQTFKTALHWQQFRQPSVSVKAVAHRNKIQREWKLFCRDAWHRFFYFSSVFWKNSDSVWNEIGYSVRF